MTHDFNCWKCGASLAALTLPFNRVDECRRCSAQLHVCRLCEFYEVTVAKQCREPVAEEVRDKEHANFCDYYQPKIIRHSTAQQDEAQRAQAQLDSLFGRSADTPAASGSASAADEARRKLDALFGGK